MKPTKILISSAAVLALGLSAWAMLGPDSVDAPGTPGGDDDAARFSNRPASKVGAPRSTSPSPRPTGPVKLTDRTPTKPTELAKTREDLNRLLTPAQQASLAAARQRAASLPPGLVAKQPRVTSSRQKAITKMQEDLRTAVKTNPSGWIETYDSLNREFTRSNGNGGYYGGGGLPGNSPDPVEPSTPEPTEPTPVEPTEPVEPAPELPLPLDEAQRLAEKYRNEQGKYLEGPTDRDGRFQDTQQ